MSDVVTGDDTWIYFYGIARKRIRDSTFVSWCSKARRNYFLHFFITSGALQFMCWQRRAQSLVPTTHRLFKPKLSRGRKITVNNRYHERPHPLRQCQFPQNKGSNSVRWWATNPNCASPAQLSRPRPTWLQAVPKSEGQTGWKNVYACRTSAKLSIQSWEVCPKSDYHGQSLRWSAEAVESLHTVQWKILWRNVLVSWLYDQPFLCYQAVTTLLSTPLVVLSVNFVF